MRRAKYPTDLTDAQWKLVRPLIPKPKPGGRPQSVNRREILNAIFHLVRGGIQRRMLPHDFPPWGTVHYYYRQWRRDGMWEAIQNALRTKVRHKAGRHESPRRRSNRQPNREDDRDGRPPRLRRWQASQGTQVKQHSDPGRDTSWVLLLAASLVHSAGIRGPCRRRSLTAGGSSSRPRSVRPVPSADWRLISDSAMGLLSPASGRELGRRLNGLRRRGQHLECASSNAEGVPGPFQA